MSAIGTKSKPELITVELVFAAYLIKRIDDGDCWVVGMNPQSRYPEFTPPKGGESCVYIVGDDTSFKLIDLSENLLMSLYIHVLQTSRFALPWHHPENIVMFLKNFKCHDECTSLS